MVDSHTHLDLTARQTGASEDELVEQARAAGVTRLLTIGTSAQASRAALDAAQRHDDVFAAVGHHPNAAGDFDDDAESQLRELARAPRCVAVGETGLDLFRDTAPRAAQERAFAAQLDLARDTGLPVVIHCREAAEPTLATLRERVGDHPVVLHCFSMPEHLDACLEPPRWVISFAGNVTYPRNADLAAAAERVPAGRLLVETDAPYLTPQPVRKERNRPAFVTHTAAFVAQRRGQTTAELGAEVDATAETLFGW